MEVSLITKSFLSSGCNFLKPVQMRVQHGSKLIKILLITTRFIQVGTIYLHFEACCVFPFSSLSSLKITSCTFSVFCKVSQTLVRISQVHGGNHHASGLCLLWIGIHYLAALGVHPSYQYLLYPLWFYDHSPLSII